MMLSSQPVISDARRTFWPLRPMAIARFSSSTTTSIACCSSSTTIDCTSAGASALMTNLRRILGPQHDVDALAGELVGHRVDARAAHADAGADAGRAAGRSTCTAILARMPGSRAAALISSRPCSISGTSSSNSSHDEFRRGARQDQLRPARRAVDLHHVGAHAVADAQVFLRDHLVARQQRLRCGPIRR